MNLLEYEFIDGFRVGTKLLYIKNEMNLCKKNSKLKKSVIFLCIHPKCKCRVKITANKECFRINEFAHDHPNKEKDYKESIVLNIIKQKCGNLNDLLNSSQFLTVRDVFNSVTAE